MWASAILSLVAVNLMLIGWRSTVVRWLPQTASLYAAIGLPVNLRSLIFTNVSTERETHDGVEVLLVQGTILNDGKRPVLAAQLARLLQRQGAEIHRLDRETEVKVAKPSPARERPTTKSASEPTPAPDSKPEAAKAQTQRVPAGSYVVRMDQPYSRMVDMMLDTQYYSTAEDELQKIFAGQVPVQQGADNIAAAWEKITDQIGRDKQLALYKASLGA